VIINSHAKPITRQGSTRSIGADKIQRLQSQVNATMDKKHFQKTIAQTVSCTGIGVHSGQQVHLKINPAPANHGIKFIRTDLPNRPCIEARFNKVVDTSQATVIGSEGFIVSTPEHLLAAFAGLEIDNAEVEIDAYELPIMDGSAGPFVAMLKSAGTSIQKIPRCYFYIVKPIAWWWTAA